MMHYLDYFVYLLTGVSGATASYYAVRWFMRRRQVGDLAIAKAQWDNAYSITLKKGVHVTQNQLDGSVAIEIGGDGSKPSIVVAKMSVLEARSLAAYIAAVTKYKHCSHYNCLEPEVPGVGYCRYHRGDILTEGVAHPPAFLPEDTNWPTNGEYQHVSESAQGRTVDPVEAEREDLTERLSRYMHGD